MAVVYLAIQESLARPVALKIVDPAHGEAPEFSQRFLAEGRIIAALRHQSIIGIHDLGVVDGRHYIVMEYVDGGDLKRRIAAGMTPREALSVVRHIASGLGVAHQAGVVHRDVKPANILFRSDGTPVLADFGVAKQLHAEQDMTLTGTVLGSPIYLSPEQATGRAVDGRADLYSLGVILFEMLTGRKPYVGKTALDTMLMHVQEPVPTLPEPLRALQPLLDRMLAKDPEGRFASAEDLIRFLDRMGPTLGVDGGGPPVSVGAPGAGSRTPASVVEAGPGTPTPGVAPERRRLRYPQAIWHRSLRPSRLHLAAGFALTGGLAGISYLAWGPPPETLAAVEATTVVAAAPAPPRVETPAALVPTPAPTSGARLPESSASTAAPGGGAGAGAAESAPALGETPRAPPAGPEPEAVAPPPTPAPEGGAEVAEGPGDEAGDRSPAPAAIPPEPAEGEVDRYVGLARQALRESRLTTPPERNAYHYLRLARRLAPDDPRVTAGIREIARRYAALAQASIDKLEYAQANAYIDRGLLVKPGDPQLLELRSQASVSRLPGQLFRRARNLF
jgi:serine/threonine-protein kinase PpkA